MPVLKNVKLFVDFLKYVLFEKKDFDQSRVSDLDPIPSVWQQSLIFCPK